MSQPLRAWKYESLAACCLSARTGDTIDLGGREYSLATDQILSWPDAVGMIGWGAILRLAGPLGQLHIPVPGTSDGAMYLGLTIDADNVAMLPLRIGTQAAGDGSKALFDSFTIKDAAVGGICSHWRNLQNSTIRNYRHSGCEEAAIGILIDDGCKNLEFHAAWPTHCTMGFGGAAQGGIAVYITTRAGTQQTSKIRFIGGLVEGKGSTVDSTTVAAGSNGVALPTATINVASTTGFPTAGVLWINGAAAVYYTGVTATTFTGCQWGTGTTLATGQTVVSHNARIVLEDCAEVTFEGSQWNLTSGRMMMFRKGGWRGNPGSETTHGPSKVIVRDCGTQGDVFMMFDPGLSTDVDVRSEDNSGNCTIGFQVDAAGQHVYEIAPFTAGNYVTRFASAGSVISETEAIKRGSFSSMSVVATANLPAAAAAMDGTVLIEDNGAGDRNLIVYAGAQRFRIDGGANV